MPFFSPEEQRRAEACALKQLAKEPQLAALVRAAAAKAWKLSASDALTLRALGISPQ